jgi:hypothetical protein
MNLTKRWIAGLVGGYVCFAAPVEGAMVSISPSSSTVAQGGSIAFTVTVQPSTYVQQVAVSYPGEGAQDVGGSAPFQTTHTFDTAGDGLLVTATVTYNNGDPVGQATASVNVVGLIIAGSTSPVRASQVTYSVQSNPAGKSLSQINWTYAWGGGYNTSTSTTWGGKMVVGGTLTVSAVVGGVTAQVSRTISVVPRSWTTPITCAQDNDPDFGDVPTVFVDLGMNRDRDSDVDNYVFVPRNSGVDFTPARWLSQVPDGPCAGWWFVGSSTLKCQRETVINRYIKSDGPVLGSTNFYGANTYCFSTSPGDFVQAVKNHEYRGTPDTAQSPDGHQGRIEKSILDDGHDAKQAIEGLLDRECLNLSSLVDATILIHEIAICSFYTDEVYMETWGPNWGSGEGLGTGQHSCWDDQRSTWTDCVNNPDTF